MTDRELLEAAARAAGMIVQDRGTIAQRCMQPSGATWNPLTDDGDALRLAVDLRMQLDITSFGCIVYRQDRPEPYGECGYAATRDLHGATRLAIVRAAAGIGNKLEKSDE